MAYIFKVVGVILKFFGKYRRLIPGSLAGIFLIYGFFQDIGSEGISVAYQNLATSILATELTINRNVHLAIADSYDYGLVEFFEIFVSIFILYTVLKFFHMLIIDVAGGQARKSAWAISAIIVFAVEASAVAVVIGEWGFIPFYDGLYFLFVNAGVVFSNIIGSSAGSAVLSSNSSVNDSLLGFCFLFLVRKFYK